MFVSSLVEDDHTGCDCCCCDHHHHHHHPLSGSMITSPSAHLLCGCSRTLLYYSWSLPPLLLILPVFPWSYEADALPPPPVASPFISINQWETTLLEPDRWLRKQIFFCLFCFFVKAWREMFKEILLHARNGFWRKHILNTWTNQWAQNKGFLWDLQGKGNLHFMPFNVFIVLVLVFLGPTQTLMATSNGWATKMFLIKRAQRLQLLFKDLVKWTQ